MSNTIVSQLKIVNTAKFVKNKETNSKPKTVKSPNLKNSFRFDNWAPEVINGRLAMLGTVSGGGYEYLTHNSVLEQPHALEAFIISSFLLTYASLKTGNPLDDLCKSVKPFTPDVEMLNGRIAMLGIAAYLANQFI